MRELLTTIRGPRGASRRAAFALFALLFFAAGWSRARAQGQPEGPPPPPAQEQALPPRRAEATADLVRTLNLSPAQRAEIARIRREVEPQSRAVGRRLRQARRALDEAIYAPADDEALIEQRAAELSAAEAERVRLRAQTELRIRRLLTPEQLSVFRELRLRALARQQRRMNRRNFPAARPGRPRGEPGGPPPPSASPTGAPDDDALGASPAVNLPRGRRLPAAAPRRRARVAPRP